MTPTSPRRTDEAGFTLMEMLVVMTIMAIVAAVAITQIPAAGSVGKRVRLAVLARQALQTGRIRAMAEGQDVTIKSSDLAPAADQLSIAGTGGNPTMTFFPDGTASGGAVMLGSKAILNVDWLTGSISDAS